MLYQLLGAIKGLDVDPEDTETDLGDGEQVI